MRLASRIDKTPVGDHNIHGPVMEVEDTCCLLSPN